MSHKGVAVLTPPAKVAATPAAVEPTEQEIAVRAHELYEQRGCEAGHELEDWLRAERELKGAEKR